MKKIMFSSKYSLEQAVLEGRKTMTRRIISNDWLVCHDDKGNVKIEYKKLNGRGYFLAYVGKNDEFPTVLEPAYQIGEVVAVAQCYEDAILSVGEEEWNKRHKWYNIKYCCHEKGLHNKMFVRADLMPHHIRINEIKVERLQDISDADCIKEGVFLDVTAPKCYQPFYTFVNSKTKDNTPIGFENPRYAFHVLIDKISGKDTWDKNPFVFAYSFELVK